MRVTLFESITLNGMIARADGRGDFFTSHCWAGFRDIANEAGALVWSRTTHDHVRGFAAGIGELRVKGLVLTRDPAYPTEEGWTTAASPEAAVATLAADGAEHVIVAGGQTVNTSFASAGLLDEVVVFVESVVIGRGLTVLADRDMPDLRLRPTGVSQPTDSVIH